MGREWGTPGRRMEGWARRREARSAGVGSWLRRRMKIAVVDAMKMRESIMTTAMKAIYVNTGWWMIWSRGECGVRDAGSAFGY